jgi:hypothetical protein
MDSEHWISRLAAAKRFYAAQLGHVDGMRPSRLFPRIFVWLSAVAVADL